MKTIIATITLLLLVGPTYSQTREDEAAAAIALAQAKAKAKKKVEPVNPPKVVWLSYSAGANESVARGCPLVTFVGCPVRALNDSGTVWCGASTLTGYPSTRLGIIVVSVPDGKGWLNWKATLPGDATDAQILDTLKPKVVQPMASPFSSSQSSSGREQAADDDLERGPWPMTLEFPKGFIRYQRAKRTQRIAVTDGRDSITPLSRKVLDAKYHQSGGMLGLLFRSDVYKLASVRPRVYVGDIQVLNEYGYYQPNRGWKREYPEGAAFMDVLSNSDTEEVFEVRKLEKRGNRPGDWYAFVEYENPDARPAGYSGKIGVSCGSCHSEAGTGNYAEGLVIGGDMILSDPFPALEK